MSSRIATCVVFGLILAGSGLARGDFLDQAGSDPLGAPAWGYRPGVSSGHYGWDIRLSSKMGESSDVLLLHSEPASGTHDGYLGSGLAPVELASSENPRLPIALERQFDLTMPTTFSLSAAVREQVDDSPAFLAAASERTLGRPVVSTTAGVSTMVVTQPNRPGSLVATETMLSTVKVSW